MNKEDTNFINYLKGIDLKVKSSAVKAVTVVFLDNKKKKQVT